jgi:PAS domain S-box-containing protein
LSDRRHISGVEAGILLLLSAGIFVLDLLAPIGVSAWLLYLLPLALTFLLPRHRAPFYYSALVTFFMFAAYAFNPAIGLPRSSDLLNRVIGLTAIWVLAFVVSRKRARTGSSPAGFDREAPLPDRSRDEASFVRSRTAEVLLAGQLRLESIVQSAMDAIITIDERQSIVLFNHAAELMFGCLAQEALGKPLDRFIPDRFRAAHRDHIVAFGKSGTTSRRMGALGQVRALTAGGEEFPVEASISQISVDGRKFFTVILRDTRERERLKRDLEEREALLRTIIEAEPECVKVLSVDGTIQSMNAAGLTMLEAEGSGEVVGKAACDFVVEEHRPGFTKLLTNAAQGHPGLLEFEAIGLRGSRRWLECHAVPLPGGEEGISGILAVTRDVTSRKQAEAELKHSEERLRSILASMEEVVWSNSVDGSEILYASPAVDRVYGRSATDLIGQPALWLDMIHSEDRPAVEQAIHALPRLGHFDLEYRIRHPNGEVRCLRHRGRLITDDQGRPIRVDGMVSDVTKTKTAESAMRKAQERFEDIFESSKDAIGYVSLDETFVLANEAFAALTGYSREELLSKTHGDLTPPEFRIAQAKEAARVLQTGEPAEYEKEYVRKDGSRVPVAVTLFLVKGDDGKPDGVAAIVRDITERRRAEQALRESEERFREMAETVQEAIWIRALYPDQVLYVSPAFARIWGLSPEHLYRDPGAWMQAVHDGERDKVAAQFAQWLADEGRETEYDVEYRIVRPDGIIRWIHDRGSLIRNKEGRIYRATGIAEDITDRKATEVLLLQSEQRYRQLVEVSPDAIVITRGELIVFINREGLELLGAAGPDHVVGRSLFDFIHPDSHDQAKERLGQLNQGSDQVPLIEQKFVRINASIVDVEVTAARYMDQEGPAIQFVLRDITQRKRLQEQLRRTERVAELGTLASGMAHEIGTPMNVILGRAEYLMNRTSDEPIKKGLQTIVSQVERITRVMNQLLSFARRETPERRAVNLSEIVENSLEMFHERFARHHIEIETEFEPACPPVHADADQMSQVLINLLMNAIHAMPDGGRIRITVRQSDRNMVDLIIADTGSGMPPEVSAKIFDPFFTTKEFGTGTGLGLTVVKGIMEEHGGEIAVTSEPGHGTIFTLELPVSEA